MAGAKSSPFRRSRSPPYGMAPEVMPAAFAGLEEPASPCPDSRDAVSYPPLPTALDPGFAAPKIRSASGMADMRLDDEHDVVGAFRYSLRDGLHLSRAIDPRAYSRVASRR